MVLVPKNPHIYVFANFYTQLGLAMYECMHEGG